MDHVLLSLDNIANISNSLRDIFSCQQWIEFQNSQYKNEPKIQECLQRLQQLSILSKDLYNVKMQLMAPDYINENPTTPQNLSSSQIKFEKPENVFQVEINLDQIKTLPEPEFQQNNNNQSDNKSCMDEDQNNNSNSSTLDQNNITNSQQIYGHAKHTTKKIFTNKDEILILQNYEDKLKRQILYKTLAQKKYQINTHYHSLLRQMKKNNLTLSQFLNMKQRNLRIKKNQNQNIFSAQEQIQIIQNYPNKDKRKQLFWKLNVSQESIKIKYNNIIREMRENNMSVQDFVRQKEQQCLLLEKNVKVEHNDDTYDIMRVQHKTIKKVKDSL